MSDFDLFDEFAADQPATLEEEKPRPPRKRQRGGGGFTFFDLLTGIFVLATIAVCVWTVLLIQNPAVPYNPFPPPTPGPTSTLFLLGGESADINPPTWTPSATVQPGPTATRLTPLPSDTPKPTATGITPLPGATNTVAVFPFTLQNEAVTYAKNNNAKGCDWLGIAGQVFDLNGEPVPGLPIQVTGDQGFSVPPVFTGTAEDLGPSGYEIKLADEPKEAEYVVRLLNTTGMPLSEPIVVRTLSSCDRNVAIVNFVQNHEFSH
jgi:hypothetical protein